MPVLRKCCAFRSSVLSVKELGISSLPCDAARSTAFCFVSVAAVTL